MIILPDSKTMSALAPGARKIPVTVRIPWQSPFEAYQKVQAPNSFLLESVNGPPRIARYSMIGLEPYLIFESKGAKSKLLSATGEKLVVGDPFEVLRQTAGQFTLRSHKRFCGAAAGYLSYDLGRFVEELPSVARDDLKLPDAVFLFCGVFLVFDHAHRTAEAVVMVDDDGHLSGAYRRAEEKIESIVAALNCPAPPVRGGAGGRQISWTSNFTKDEFCRAVLAAKDYIAAGDIYQVNISQRLTAPTVSSPLQIYSILRELNPSPFAGYFDFGNWQLVGCSPERLVKLEDGMAQTRPIAGTIRRGRTEMEDWRLRRQLTHDIKERAEHIMLVDLERNDLGRVCEYGSIQVDELIVTETYSHVSHIVSNVKGKLQAKYDGFDLIKACFPGGTITGCPKVRAMEIIEELEPVKRGPYTGSMGYIGFNGSLDLNIIIRTLMIKGGLAYVQAGAGIVADSDPEREYYETLYKAEALVRATTLSEERHGCLPT